MRLITAVYSDPARAIKPHELMAENLRRSAERLGYELTIHQLESNPVVFATKDYYRLDCAFKPFLIQKELETATEPVCWVDADCLIRERFDEILDGVHLAVTMRPLELRRNQGQVYDGFINAGVMAFTATDAARTIVDYWIKELKRSRSDQDAMTYVLLRESKLLSESEVIRSFPALVRIAPTRVYNFFHFPDDWSQAKVLHVKGIHRPEEYDEIARAVLGKDAVPTAGAKEEACR